MVTARGSAIATIKEGHTGRIYIGAEEYGRASEWAKQATLEQILSHPGCGEFKQHLNETQVRKAALMICFRGRRDPSFKNAPPAAKQMGPPGGRYDGPRPLYLCNTEDGVRREFRNLQDREGPLYVQQYYLPTDRLKLADFVELDERSFVNNVFKFCEDCNFPERVSSAHHALGDSYQFSQAVAHLVKTANFDGMVVRGVHGGEPGDNGEWRTDHYTNVVIFEPITWETWLAPTGPALAND